MRKVHRLFFVLVVLLFFPCTSLGSEKKYDDVFDAVVAVQLQMSAYIKKLPNIINVKMTKEEMEFIIAAKSAFRLSINKSDHLYRVAYNMHSCGNGEVGCRALLFKRCIKLNERVKKEISGYLKKITSYRKVSDSHIIGENIEQVIGIEKSLIKQIDKLCK